MSKLVIADSTCLIGLSRIGKLDILRDLFGTITIPDAVFYEVVTLGKGRPGAIDVKKAEWIAKLTVKNRLAVSAFKFNLGAGESEAIALASENETDYIILDDRKARDIATGLSLSVIGTVAVLNKAAQKRIIKDFQKVLKDLKNAGFHYEIIKGS